jgi:Phospholipid-binding protein
MKITSSAFQEGGNIPSKFTCDGSDTSPPLQITGVPSEAKSLVLIAMIRMRPADCLLIGWSGTSRHRPIQLRKAVRQKACTAQMILANQVTGSVSAPRHTSVFVQDFRSRSRTGFALWCKAEPSGCRDERSCHRTGRARRTLRKKKITVAAVSYRRNVGHLGLTQHRYKEFE